MDVGDSAVAMLSLFCTQTYDDDSETPAYIKDVRMNFPIIRLQVYDLKNNILNSIIQFMVENSFLDFQCKHKPSQ